MLINILVSALGLITLFFLFWRRLKEDYASEMIFSTLFYITFGLILGLLVTNYYFTSWWFWGAFVGILIGLAVGVFRFKLRIFETFEAMVFSVLPWLFYIFIGQAIKENDLVSFGVSLLIICFLIIFTYFSNYYKTFTWYKSGKVGFAGLMTAGIFFLSRSFVAISFSGMLSFVGKEDAIISGTLAFLFFLTVFNLARKN